MSKHMYIFYATGNGVNSMAQGPLVQDFNDQQYLPISTLLSRFHALKL